MRCSSDRRVKTSLLLSFLISFPTTAVAQQVPLQLPSQQQNTAANEHVFTLRHIFHRGTYRDPKLHKRLDIRPHHDFVATYDEETPVDAETPRFTARSNPIQIERLVDRSHESIDSHLDYSTEYGVSRVLDSQHWTMDEMPGPNTTDRDTVINLAVMAANAYVPIYHEGEWEDVWQGFNLSQDFGWEGDGLRGHIFADEGNKTIVIGLKGTSPALFDGDGTTTRDKLNDNLFFGCCCGQGGQYFWRQVCDCQTETYKCNQTCLIQNLRDKTLYYTAARELYTNVTALYPNSTFWIVGHSLGGALSSMIGLTYGIPAVTYEAPGDDLPIRRLGLPVPSHSNQYRPFRHKNTGAVHFGHTADPIFMGTCNGATSLCTLGGYAMESQCHTGTVCTYDTVGDLGWRVALGYHRVHHVIDNVMRQYPELPACVPDSECTDCFNWRFFESNGSDSTTTATTLPTSTSTLTRTTTCRTPGWWGCLDESSTPVITTTYTTTSCARPGWFGCNEEVNVTVTTTTESPTTTSTTPITVCKTPGFWGCEDETFTASSTKYSSHTPSVTSVSTSCKTPGLFFGCYDEETTTAASTSSTIASWTTETETCETPGLFFGCWDEPTSFTTTTATPTITSPPSTVAPSFSSTSASSTSKKHKHEEECKHPAFFGLICLDD